MSRICIVCGAEKPLGKFSSYVLKKTGVRYFKNTCSYCKHRKRDIKKKYGITIQQYNQMVQEQNGECAICQSTVNPNSRKNNLDIDHDHKTGKVRGLLCNRCNKGLGVFRDDITLLTRAIEYLLK